MGQILFCKTHEWIMVENDIATVGITDYAQSQLGDVVFVELPQGQTQLAKNDTLATIESTKAASEVYAPVTGTIVEINSQLADNPQWINESPREKAWIVKIKMSDTSELADLMDEATYKEFVAQESH